MTNKKYFTKNEALQDIKNALENGYNSYLCDLHHEVFNKDYYIVGNYSAKRALEEYGAFNAIEEVENYEKDNFGQVLTQLSNPESVANMIYYIIGEDAMRDILDSLEEDYWNEEVTEEVSKKIIKIIDNLIK